MNSKLQWGHGNSLMLWVELHKSWTWADFHNIIRKAHDMINTVNQEVSLVVWYQDQPPAGDVLSHFKSVEEHQPANLARTIVIVPDSRILSFLTNLSRMVIRVSPDAMSKLQFVRSVEAAKTLLQTHTTNGGSR